jgi:hypothetical protein
VCMYVCMCVYVYVCVCVCVYVRTIVYIHLTHFSPLYYEMTLTCNKCFIVTQLQISSPPRKYVQLGIIHQQNSDISLNCFSQPFFFVINKQMLRYAVLILFLLFEVQVSWYVKTFRLVNS